MSRSPYRSNRHGVPLSPTPWYEMPRRPTRAKIAREIEAERASARRKIEKCNARRRRRVEAREAAAAEKRAAYVAQHGCEPPPRPEPARMIPTADLNRRSPARPTFAEMRAQLEAEVPAVTRRAKQIINRLEINRQRVGW